MLTHSVLFPPRKPHCLLTTLHERLLSPASRAPCTHLFVYSQWRVGSYNLGFKNFEEGGQMENLFSGAGADCAMFRVARKSNLTRALAEGLTEHFVEALNALDHRRLSRELVRGNRKPSVTEAGPVKQEVSKSATTTTLSASNWAGSALEATSSES